MTTSFLSYAFAATGAPSTRNLPDRLADVINVKDYGAVGDGVTNDTVAIQAALNEAFGSFASPHGWSGRFSNKHVVFPAGNYKVTSSLNIKWVIGGTIRGSGAGATTITYAGAIAGGSTYTSLFYADGFKFCNVNDISFVMTGGNALADKTVAFNYDWVPSADGNQIGGSQVTFTNCKFSGATIGLLIGISTIQCDTATLINCDIDNCYYGVYAANQNAICSGMYGGSVTNCHAGIYMPSGKMETICGVSFAGNYNGNDNSSGDIVSTQEYPVFIVGCYSTSEKFACAATGYNYIAGCVHNAATPGAFARLVYGTVVIESCYSKNGFLIGHSSNPTFFYLVDLKMDSPSWAAGDGKICEWITKTPRTFAQLPTATSWFNEGLTVNISDSPTATWGANVTTGGGSNHVTIRWNGTNWTVVGI